MASSVGELERKIEALNLMEIDSLELKSADLAPEDLAPEDSELEGSESEALMPEDLESEPEDLESEPEDLESEPEDLTLEYSELECLESEDLISYKSTSEEEKPLSRNMLSVSLHAMFAISKDKLDGQKNGHRNAHGEFAAKRKNRDLDATDGYTINESQPSKRRRYNNQR